MVMVDLSYGWCGVFFMKKLVDFDKEICVPSVLSITGTTYYYWASSFSWEDGCAAKEICISDGYVCRAE